MRAFLLFIVFFILLCSHVFFLENATLKNQELTLDTGGRFVFPSKVLKIVSLEYRSIISDFLLLESLAFYGKTVERSEKKLPDLSEEQWQWLYRALSTSTELDPFFLDPYYFANAVLTLKPDKLEAVNGFLEKGVSSRYWDWQIPFYLGYNYFFYLDDNDRGAEFVMIAARRSEESSLLATLAARLAYKGRKTENAIIFLQEILKKTDDPDTRHIYEMRLGALKMVFYLEKAVKFYRQKFGELPNRIDDLVRSGVIAVVPSDPYGGQFYLSDDGFVKTTSNFVLK
jgi:hypothetical protein